jgi:hypothetical protein
VRTQPASNERGDFQHPPFNEKIRTYIKQIQEAFAEHFPQSFEEWENGFRRDPYPSQQIAVWWYAADIYREFALHESCQHRRADIYKCVLSCMTASHLTIWDVYQPEAITVAEADQIIGRYYLVVSLGQSDPLASRSKTQTRS